VLICNQYTYSVTLDTEPLLVLTELGYFFACLVFQSLANNEINSEPKSNLDLIIRKRTKKMPFMKDNVRYVIFTPFPKKRVFIMHEHKQQLQVRKTEKCRCGPNVIYSINGHKRKHINVDEERRKGRNEREKIPTYEYISKDLFTSRI
jgi:hypothetical protein